jgi:hypothetical protein
VAFSKPDSIYIDTEVDELVIPGQLACFNAEYGLDIEETDFQIFANFHWDNDNCGQDSLRRGRLGKGRFRGGKVAPTSRLSDEMVARQARKANVARLVATHAVRIHEIAGGHLFQRVVQIVGNERLVFEKDQWTRIQRRLRRSFQVWENGHECLGARLLDIFKVFTIAHTTTITIVIGSTIRTSSTR